LALEARFCRLAGTIVGTARQLRRRPCSRSTNEDVGRPDECSPLGDQVESSTCDQFAHPRLRMHERPETISATPQRILQFHARSDVPAISRIRECKPAFRVAHCLAQELFIQRIATDHTIERHDAGGRQRSREFHEIATLEFNVGCATTPRPPRRMLRLLNRLRPRRSSLDGGPDRAARRSERRHQLRRREASHQQCPPATDL